MVGVASPMLRYGPMVRYGRSVPYRLLTGLTVGLLLASFALALVAWVIGTSLASFVPLHARLLLLAALCLVFGVADLLNRTPHVRRQVPQVFIRRLPPGELLGITWGFDLGLLFTTQKVVSLLWVALAAIVLVVPDSGWLILGTAAMLEALTIAGASAGGWRGVDNFGTKVSRAWTRRMKAFSGLALMAIAVIPLSQALQV